MAAASLDATKEFEMSSSDLTSVKALGERVHLEDLLDRIFVQS